MSDSQRLTDWEAAAGLLRGIYEAMFRYKFIVHMANLKALINTCQVNASRLLLLSAPSPDR